MLYKSISRLSTASNPCIQCQTSYMKLHIFYFQCGANTEPTHPQQFSLALLQITRTQCPIAPPMQPIGNAIPLLQDLLKGTSTYNIYLVTYTPLKSCLMGTHNKKKNQQQIKGKREKKNGVLNSHFMFSINKEEKKMYMEYD